LKTLLPSRIELIDALVAEGSHGQLTAAWLEKDEHLTDALRTVFALQLDSLQLVLCGGTSLSKGFAIIERMSEDVDLKVLLIGEQSKSQTRKRLSSLKSQISEALNGIGLIEDAEKASARNENRYIHTQWTYSKQYPSIGGIRPNLQIELTTRAPLLDLKHIEITSLAERFAPQLGTNPFKITVVSPAETMAEKVLSFLRRFTQHRNGKMLREWDVALVRHIYDVHCLRQTSENFLPAATSVFAALVATDVEEFGAQDPEFAANPGASMQAALKRVSSDLQSQEEYQMNLLPLVYGNYKPAFDEAFKSFETTAIELLNTLSA
jgi:predicted nucleotidyltransferase component of viral defense system